MPKTYRTSARTLNGTEADEHRRVPRRISQDGRIGILLGRVVVHLEVSMGTRTASMNDTLRDTFMIEAMNLLAGNLVHSQGVSGEEEMI